MGWVLESSHVPFYTRDLLAFSFMKHSRTLHQGDSMAGTLLGACPMSPCSSTIKLGLEDPKDSSGVIWEELRYRLGQNWTGKYDLSEGITLAVDGAAKKSVTTISSWLTSPSV